MSEYTQDQQPRGGFGRRNTDRVATARLAVNQGDGNRKGVNPVGLKFGTSMAGAVRYDPDEVNEWQEKRKMQVQFDSIADAQEFISNLALRYSLTADDLEQLKGEHTNG